MKGGEGGRLMWERRRGHYTILSRRVWLVGSLNQHKTIPVPSVKADKRDIIAGYKIEP